MSGALEGVRVLDIATVIAGPGIAARLGDFGADVIKVEHPERGDTTRELGWKVRGEALWWKQISRNKRPVTLNLSHPEGQNLLVRLAETADVLIESFRPGTLEGWNLAPERLHQANPRLVVCRVSGFGQDGPYARRPGFGSLAEAMSGLAHMTGMEDGPPILPPIALADEVAGVLGAYAIMLALYHRDAQGGAGQVIDLSLFEGLFSMTGPVAAVYDRLHLVTGRHGNRIHFAAPRNAYETGDGRWVAVSGTSQSVAERIFRAIGRPDLIEDPRFATNEDRVQHAAELAEAIGTGIAGHTLEEVMGAFGEEEAAVAPVLDIEGIFRDIQYRARHTIVQVPDEDLGEVTMPAAHPRLSETPGEIRHTGLGKGAANADVYGELGLGDEDLARLRGDGVI